MKNCSVLFARIAIIVVVIFIVVVWGVIPLYFGWALRYTHLMFAGREIADMVLSLSENSNDGNITTDFTEMLRVLQNQQPEHQKKWYSSDLWFVIESVPENPPENLVVIATRNIDPASLRTKLSYADMSKKVSIKWNDHSSILRKHAIFVYTYGYSRPIPKNLPERLTYKYIYDGQPFDCATNSTSGLPVGYLTSDGKVVVPANN